MFYVIINKFFFFKSDPRIPTGCVVGSGTVLGTPREGGGLPEISVFAVVAVMVVASGLQNVNPRGFHVVVITAVLFLVPVYLSVDGFSWENLVNKNYE